MRYIVLDDPENNLQVHVEICYEVTSSDVTVNEDDDTFEAPFSLVVPPNIREPTVSLSLPPTSDACSSVLRK